MWTEFTSPHEREDSYSGSKQVRRKKKGKFVVQQLKLSRSLGKGKSERIDICQLCSLWDWLTAREEHHTEWGNIWDFSRPHEEMHSLSQQFSSNWYTSTTSFWACEIPSLHRLIAAVGAVGAPQCDDSHKALCAMYCKQGRKKKKKKGSPAQWDCLHTVRNVS